MSVKRVVTIGLKSKFLISLLVIAACGILGMAAYSGLSALYQPPKEKERNEPRIEVQTVVLIPQSYTMQLRGWGEAKSIETVPISSKVPGEVVEVHPALKMGNLVSDGEVLLRIDDSDIKLLQAQAQSQVDKAESSVARMKAQFELDTRRFRTLQRSLQLASEEFEKDKSLYTERNIGSQSMVNASELQYNQMRDSHDQVKNALELFPTMLEEAESMLKATKLQLEKADLDLSRTVIRAPLDGRIKFVQVEAGQTVAPGIPLIILSNDSELELSVALDSYEARKWLIFAENPDAAEMNWFADPEPVECIVRWTEDEGMSAWKGTLKRVERYDPMTRTVTVAVGVKSGESSENGSELPLVDGMFCAVEIEGITLENVYILPRWAVSYEAEINIAQQNEQNDEYRLKRLRVEVLSHQGEETIIAATLPAGTKVITTVLHSPLRNSLLNIHIENDLHAAGDNNG